MKTSSWYVMAMTGLAAMLLLSMSFFCVRESERALVSRLGELKKHDGEIIVYSPGLHWKWPLVEAVKGLDARLQTLDIKSSRIPTTEKKDVLVNLYIKWRVQDFAKFYVRSGAGISGRSAYQIANQLLTQKAIDSVRSEIGRRTIKEVVSLKRAEVMDKVLQDIQMAAQHELGVEIVDVRMKRIDLPDDVSSAIYTLMSTERERTAAQHRAQGRRQAEKIRADADAQVTRVEAQALKEAMEIRAQGQAAAAAIYQEAYQADPEFYTFMRSLEIFEKGFQKPEDKIILDPHMKIFDYMRPSEDAR